MGFESMNTVTIMVALFVVLFLVFATYMGYRELKEESGSGDDGMTPTMHCRIMADREQNVP